MTKPRPLNEQITNYFGGENWPEIFRKLSANEALLSAVWQQYQLLMSDGEIDVAAKELMGLAIAVTKPNEYMINFQQRRVRRVAVDEEAEKEAMIVAGFFDGLDAFDNALHVDSDLHPRKQGGQEIPGNASHRVVHVPYIEESGDEVVQHVYREIQERMEIEFVPNIFKAMAHQPLVLQAKWESYKAIMLEGVVPRRTKELIAIAVSALNSGAYCVDAHSAAGRQLGLTEKGLVEAACVVDLFATLCTLAKGFRLGKRNF